MPLTPCEDPKAVDWITQGTVWSAKGTVASLVPPVFGAYAQVLHAVHLAPGLTSLAEVPRVAISDAAGSLDKMLSERGVTLPPGVISRRSRSSGTVGRLDSQVRVRWDELAAAFGSHLGVPASFERDLWDPLPGDWPDELDGPVEGSLTVAEFQALTSILPSGPDEPVTFWLGYLHSLDWLGGCYEGWLTDAADYFDLDNVRGSPEYMFPASRTWLVYTDYDQSYTLVGGSRDTIDALLAAPELECIELKARTLLA